MNDRQACRRIRSLLRARLWGGWIGESGVGSKVWKDRSIRVSLGPLSDSYDAIPPPGVLIAPGSTRNDPEEPGLLSGDIRVLLFSAAAGDQTGEGMLMGHGRADATSSRGRGILEFQKELLDAVKLLNAGDELPIQFRAASAVGPISIEEVGYLVQREYLFTADLTDVEEHLPVSGLSGSQVASDVVLTWTAPDDTTDLVSYVVRRVSGKVPTPHPDGGTDITLDSALAVTLTDEAPATGTYTYSVFAGYDEEGGTAPVHHSDYEAVTVTVT